MPLCPRLYLRNRLLWKLSQCYWYMRNVYKHCVTYRYSSLIMFCRHLHHLPVAVFALPGVSTFLIFRGGVSCYGLRLVWLLLAFQLNYLCDEFLWGGRGKGEGGRGTGRGRGREKGEGRREKGERRSGRGRQRRVKYYFVNICSLYFYVLTFASSIFN